jgi:hypothetical protein
MRVHTRIEVYAHARAHMLMHTYIDARSEEGRGGSKEVDGHEHVQRFQYVASLYGMVCQAGAKYVSMSAVCINPRYTISTHIYSFSLPLSMHEFMYSYRLYIHVSQYHTVILSEYIFMYEFMSYMHAEYTCMQ